MAGLVLGCAETSGDWQNAMKGLLGASGSGTAAGALSIGEIGGGLKEALRVGTETVVGRLGRMDGFNADPQIRIPLPDSLKTVQQILGKAGMSSLLDDLHLKLNRAAEQATPKAKALFWQSIEEMTFEDVKGIYNGPEDAATRFFQRKMTLPLADEMRPIIQKSLSQVGAVQAFDNVMGKYRAIPFVPDVKANLSDHVVNKGMEGIFYYLAQEEAAIRRDPAKRTTELLQRVFSR
ncbi:MAG: DUF4197 domain-containing protein [Deltaproteobacteria bacterium]|nr:DUF4197 domain-containing protein [Deltaproteobacteria bacterium]